VTTVGIDGHDAGFNTVFGRGLVAELPRFVHRPCLIVSMDDLWPTFMDLFADQGAAVHLVETVDLEALEVVAAGLPPFESVVGLGGGQALDVAKFFAWKRRRPLFQVPTAMTVNAAFGHRFAVRVEGIVRYLGWAIPEAVYVDYDVIQAAPPHLNRSGIGDILCYHTAHFDWKLAHDLGVTTGDVVPGWMV
jgi:glycerol-1-phosphate dehydrogenase [NAD(P)+]